MDKIGTPTASPLLARIRPKGNVTTISLSLPIDLVKWVDALAARNGASRSAVFKAMIENTKAQEEGVYAA